METQDHKFLIAYNYLHPGESIIISRLPAEFSKKAYAEKDCAEFIGQAVWVCTAKIIDSIQDVDDLCCEINIEGNLTIFEVEEIVKSFPIIEGSVEAGIYNFYQSESEYYEIKSASDLSSFFEEEPNFDYINEKFICRPDGIYLYGITDNEEACFYPKHFLTFYDIYCPVCKQKVVTYKTETNSFRCEVIFLFCPHFIGSAIWNGVGNLGYDQEELNDLNVNYKLTGENLYFETMNGWQKPIIYTPPYRLDSYWNDPPEETSVASHFFFVETEPKFWIR